MTTTKHPRDLTTEEADAIVAAFAARREADARIEAAALAAHRAGLSWGAIGAQLGMTRQGARQRFERLVTH